MNPVMKFVLFATIVFVAVIVLATTNRLIHSQLQQRDHKAYIEELQKEIDEG